MSDRSTDEPPSLEWKQFQRDLLDLRTAAVSVSVVDSLHIADKMTDYVSNLRAENRQLRSERDQARGVAGIWRKLWNKTVDRLDEETLRADRAEAVVEMYATEIREAIADGRVPEGFCQGAIFRSASEHHRSVAYLLGAALASLSPEQAEPEQGGTA